MAERIKRGGEGGVMENSAGIRSWDLRGWIWKVQYVPLCGVFSLFLMVFSWQIFIENGYA